MLPALCRPPFSLGSCSVWSLSPVLNRFPRWAAAASAVVHADTRPSRVESELKALETPWVTGCCSPGVAVGNPFCRGEGLGGHKASAAPIPAALCCGAGWQEKPLTARERGRLVVRQRSSTYRCEPSHGRACWLPAGCLPLVLSRPWSPGDQNLPEPVSPVLGAGVGVFG